MAIEEKEVVRSMRRIWLPDQVYEIRVLGLKYYCTETLIGYFNDPVALSDKLDGIEGVYEGVYVTFNPVRPDIFESCPNQFKQQKGARDEGIVRRDYLMLDFDPVRESGCPATNDERTLARNKALEVRNYLTDQGLPLPIFASSGNGIHLLYRIELPVDDNGLVKSFLSAIHNRFSDNGVKIDTSVSNPSRLCRVYGTMNRKGTESEGRTHQLAQIDWELTPDTSDIVPEELLRSIVGKSDSIPSPESKKITSNSPLWIADLGDWIAKHKLDVGQPYNESQKTHWAFNVCPFNSGHTDKRCFLSQGNDGHIMFHCFHESCAGKSFNDLRDIVEPGWRDTPKDLPSWADLPATPIEWLWEDWIPKGFVTILGGCVGAGKSFLALYLAGCVTNSNPWPDGTSGPDKPNCVVWCEGENSYQLNRERAERLNLNFSLIKHPNDNTHESFNLKNNDHWKRLKDYVINRKPTLVIIDSLRSTVCGKENNSEIIDVFKQLGNLAAQSGCSIIVIHHFGKPNEMNPQKGHNKLRGSSAICQVPRVILEIDNNILSMVKNNISDLQTPIGININSDDISFPTGSKLSRLESAQQFLTDYLKDGPKSKKDIDAQARTLNIADVTLDRAKNRLKIDSEKRQDGWYWSLPGAQESDQESHE